MKRLIFIVLVSLFVVSLTSSATAEEQKLPLTATASSTYYNPSYYGPAKAVDGNTSTYWIGDRNASPWWIQFDVGTISQIGDINITWYPHSYYCPTDYDIQVSNDAVSWENVYSGIKGTYGSAGEIREINRETRYIRLYIRAVPYGFPILKEFEAYTKISIPQVMRFQGTLGDAQGAPLDGTFQLTFRLYDTDTGGTPLWEEVQQNLTIENGLLDVELGSVTALDLPFDKQYWLGVEVESDGEMTPRFKLTTVPYAFRSVE